MAFPTDLSDVTTGDDITASRNNAITNKIGVDNSAVATSLDYLIKNTSSKLGKIASLSDSDGNFIVGSASGWVAESGSTARTSIGLGSVENTALSTWAGTTNITTLGTITTGTWSGTAVAVSKGGTGSTTASAARTALGVAIGSDVQAYDADLTELAGLSDSDGNFIVGSASGWVAESGATARTSIGLGSVENTALSTWAGTTNVTTLGTVSTGTWTGTVVADEYGGTGQSAYAAGDILYASGANVLARLAISVTEDHVLSVSSGGLPEWAAAGGGGGATAFDGSAPAATNAATMTVSDASDPALTITQSGAGGAVDIQDRGGASMVMFDDQASTSGSTPGNAVLFAVGSSDNTAADNHGGFSITPTHRPYGSGDNLYTLFNVTDGGGSDFIKCVPEWSGANWMYIGDTNTSVQINGVMTSVEKLTFNTTPSNARWQMTGPHTIDGHSQGVITDVGHVSDSQGLWEVQLSNDTCMRFYPGTTGTSGYQHVRHYLREVFEGELVRPLETPSSASDTGVAGEIQWDASYIYICTATDTWKRVAIATW